MHRTIPLTPFVDFALMAGPNRVKVGRSLFGDPHADYYAPVRDAVVEAHAKEVAPADLHPELNRWLLSRSDERQWRIFAKVIAGYCKFVAGQGKVRWFEPPSRDVPLGPFPFCVRVDPELGLLIDGRPHVVKVHWRGDPLTKERIALVTTMLSSALAATWPGTVMAVMDIRRSRIFTPRQNADVGLLVKSEAAALAEIGKAS